MADYKALSKGKAQEESAERMPNLQNCDYCGRRLLWPDKHFPIQHGENRIIGRSKTLGHICHSCYRLPAEPDWRDEKTIAAMRAKL